MLTDKTIKYLDWDSNFFKRSIYNISIEKSISSSDIEAINECPGDLIYVVCNDPDQETIDTLASSGAILYDRKVTFEKSITQSSPVIASIIDVRSQKSSDEYLENLAYQSGEYSRFKLDPKMNFGFKNLYKTWLEKSLDGELADEVYLAFDNDENKVGFLTLIKSGNVGKIGLIAVDSNFRGRKIGVNLMLAAEEWYIKNKITKASVVTQLDNLPACSLYRKMGYQIIKTEYIFHLWKSKK